MTRRPRGWSSAGVLLAAVAASACAAGGGKQWINPDTLYDARQYYTHVITAQGGKLVFVAGQIAVDPKGEIVGAGDFAAQARQAFGNLRRALAAAGAAPTDVVKINIYVLDYRRELLPAITAAFEGVFSPGRLPTSTLIGVPALARDGLLIEVEAIAVKD
jgi:enamine deaminase RidA (YjgF/YER057c/UK114 family)